MSTSFSSFITIERLSRPAKGPATIFCAEGKKGGRTEGKSRRVPLFLRRSTKKKKKKKMGRIKCQAIVEVFFAFRALRRGRENLRGENRCASAWAFFLWHFGDFRGMIVTAGRY